MFDYKGLKHFPSLFICVFLIFSGCTGQNDKVAFDGGNGTAQSPYMVATAEQLNEVRHHLDAHFKQTADIDLAVYSNWRPIGSYDNRFAGIYDGNGHIIKNLSLERPRQNYVGLFSAADEGSLMNIVIKNARVAGADLSGILLGGNWGAIINCHVEGEITGYSIGGLAGVSFGSMQGCSAKVTVRGDGMVGGLVGTNDGNLQNCFAEGEVKGEGNLGGLVSFHNSGMILNCYSRADVIAQKGHAGGLVGFILNGPVRNCYAAGMVSAEKDTGGLIRAMHEGYIANSYYDMETSGQSDEGKGTSRTTAEMKQKATFEGWDFEEIWDIVENESYPFLRNVGNWKDSSAGK